MTSIQPIEPSTTLSRDRTWASAGRAASRRCFVIAAPLILGTAVGNSWVRIARHGAAVRACSRWA